MKDSSFEPDGCDFINRRRLAVENTIAHLRFGEPGKFKKLDTDHFEINLAGVFSKKIVDVLSKHMPIKGLQLVPAEIRDNSKKIIDGEYWVANIYQQLESFDEEKSVFDNISSMGSWTLIEKAVIDKEKLSNIPLEERLVYMAKESRAFQMYHQSIVDIINSVKPKGFVFVPVEEWYPEYIYKFMDI